MNGGGLLLALAVGSALLALWSYVRWPRAAPSGHRGAIVRVVVAFGLLQVGVVPLNAAADGTTALAVLVLVGLVVPLLTFAFLTALWVMRLFADALKGYV